MKKIIKVYYAKDLVATFRNGIKVTIGRETFDVHYYDDKGNEHITTFDIRDIRHYKVDIWLKQV